MKYKLIIFIFSLLILNIIIYSENNNYHVHNDSLHHHEDEEKNEKSYGFMNKFLKHEEEHEHDKMTSEEKEKLEKKLIESIKVLQKNYPQVLKNNFLMILLEEQTLHGHSPLHCINGVSILLMKKETLMLLIFSILLNIYYFIDYLRKKK